jgi:putative nucleotidyltransferase with HDIG domain
VRVPALKQGAQDAHYQLIARPFFAKPLTDSLVEHAKRWLASPSREDSQRIVAPLLQSAGESAELPTAPAAGRLAFRRVLLAFAEVAEARSGSASGHGARVSALAGVLAEEAGLVGESRDAVEDAAMLHDVGELALDPQLLQKRRLLSDAERKAVRHHVIASVQIVRRAGLPPAVVEAVRAHHERWDGSGYPDGLRGDQIPLGARVIAVADTWDALATDRPYRSAVPLDRCVGELAALAGRHLDPRLVALYLDRKLYELIDWSDPPRSDVKLL